MRLYPTGPESILEYLAHRAEQVGLAMRGACHPQTGEFPQLALPAGQATLVLLGFTADLQWPAFERSQEARDALPHPLDRWSRRVIGTLAHEFAARDFYPGDSPIVPFQQLAMRCDSVYPSPVGVLIHPRWGLWHAYRGGLIFPTQLGLPERSLSPSPCTSCETKPCLSACPVGAFSPQGYDHPSCLNHVAGPGGRDCREGGCLARRACPVGPLPGYAPTQHQFHMSAFLSGAARLTRTARSD